MTRRLAGLILAVVTAASASSVCAQTPPIHRLCDALNVFFHNPDGVAFDLTLELRDINHSARGPAEVLVKVYRPDGTPAVRQVIPDDSVSANTYAPPMAGYDHEAWYYAGCYSNGLEPAVRWSAWTDPARVAQMPKRTFHYTIAASGPGVYRLLLVGQSDVLASFTTNPYLKYGLSGSPDLLQGRGEQFQRGFIYIPRRVQGLDLQLLELDQPAGRSVTIHNAQGDPLLSTDESRGYTKRSLRFQEDQDFDDQVLRVEVSSGRNDYLLGLHLAMPYGNRLGKPGGRLFAVICPDEETARAIQGGAIYHDDAVYFQGYAVRMHDYLKTLTDDDFESPPGLHPNPKPLVSLGSHQSPQKGAADLLIHDYLHNHDRGILNTALRDMLACMARMGHDDHVMTGPNLAYEMGAYSFFYIRPAWRIITDSEAPQPVKDILREFVIQVGDRLAFCRGVELVNGNAAASILSNLRYCVAATDDDLHRQLFDTYWDRFTTGGFGARLGLGPSGGVQENFGYDFHYGSYVLRGWEAPVADLHEERFAKLLDRLRVHYTYVWTPEVAGGAWSSRTSAKLPKRTYEPSPEWPFKGDPGPDFTVSLNNAHEFFAARRASYYALTYHGRLSPSWIGQGVQGQIGFGGGMLCQLHVPGKGPVIVSRLHGNYGEDMAASRWRQFAIHSVVGTTADDLPLITADSEHGNARLEGAVLTSSGDVRRSSIRATRRYEFRDDSVHCQVQLERAHSDSVYAIWGSGSKQRGVVREAYELIPTLGFKPGKEGSTNPADRLELQAFDGQGQPLGPVDESRPTVARSITLDRGGYGVKIELDEERPVLRRFEGALLVQLVGRDTQAGKVSLEYTLRPQTGAGPVAQQSHKNAEAQP